MGFDWRGVTALGCVLGLFFVCDCGGGAPEPKSPEAKSAPGSEASPASSEKAAESEESEEKGPVQVPKSCAKQGDNGECLPSERFVKALCDDVYADVALVMFQGGTPWTRAYLTRKTEAWNASGGASVQGELAFDEEVLILRKRGARKDGIQVSGASGGYDALRWNGSCVTLSGEEVTLQKPPRPGHSRVEWKWVGESMRQALKANPDIQETYAARRKECKGVSLGTVTKRCEQLDEKLVDVIVQFVRDGGELGKPEFP